MTPTSSAIVICTVGNPALTACIESLCLQSRRPDVVMIVTGGPPSALVAAAVRRLGDAGIESRVASCAPGLVRQRNLLLPEVTQDVVYFIDDDAELAPDYLERTLETYDNDPGHLIGGVQGVIAEHAYRVPLQLSKLFRRAFMLTETTGTGRLKSSGHPSFKGSVTAVTDVDVILGCAMSFRRTALGDGFDRAFEERWWGDDFTMSYAVSRKFRVVQIPGAVFWHKPGHSRPDKDFSVARMQVVNRWYVHQKYLEGRSKTAFLWASVGEFVQGLFYLMRGRPGVLRGVVAGWRDLAGARGRE